MLLILSVVLSSQYRVFVLLLKSRIFARIISQFSGMKRFLQAFILGLLALLQYSCYNPDDFDFDKMSDAEVDYDWAMPLVDARLGIDNLVEPKEGVFQPDDAGLMHIIYSMEPSTYQFLPDVNISASSPVSESLGTLYFYPYRDTVVEAEFDGSFSLIQEGIPEGTEIKEIRLSRLSLDFFSMSTFNEPVQMRMVLENVYDLSGRQVEVMSNPSSTGSTTTTHVFENVKVVFDASDDMEVKVKTRMDWDHNPVPGDSVLRSGTMQCSLSMTSMDFARVDGYMAQIPYNLTGELPVSGLSAQKMENINFKTASIHANIIVDGMSVPLRIEKSDVVLDNANGTSRVQLIPDNYDITYPLYNASPMVATSELESTLENLVVDKPKSFSFDMTGKVNPDADRNVLQALEEGANVSVGLVCDVPMWFSAERYMLEDTIPFALEGMGSDILLHYLEFKTIVKNAFPLDMEVTLTFLDGNYDSIYSLLVDYPVKGGVVGPEPDLHVQEPVVTTSENRLYAEIANKVKAADYVRLAAKVRSTDQKVVKVYATSETEGFLDIRMGFRAKVTKYIEF